MQTIKVLINDWNNLASPNHTSPTESPTERQPSRSSKAWLRSSSLTTSCPTNVAGEGRYYWLHSYTWCMTMDLAEHTPTHKPRPQTCKRALGSQKINLLAHSAHAFSATWDTSHTFHVSRTLLITRILRSCHLSWPAWDFSSWKVCKIIIFPSLIALSSEWWT